MPQRGITKPCNANNVNGGSHVIRTHTVTCRTHSGCNASHAHASPGCAAEARRPWASGCHRGAVKTGERVAANRIYPSRVVYPPRCGENGQRCRTPRYQAVGTARQRREIPKPRVSEGRNATGAPPWVSIATRVDTPTGYYRTVRRQRRQPYRRFTTSSEHIP